MSFQLNMLGDFELIMSQFIFANYMAPYLKDTSSEENVDSIFNKKITIETVKSNTEVFEGKSAEEIAQMMRGQGYDVIVRNSTQSRSGAVIIEVTNVSETAGRNIKQVQVSPGGGRHGELPYVKISTVSPEVGKIKIVMGPEELYDPSGERNVTVIFTGGD